ncbi:MAG: sigma factor [Oscillospiraceae bacterium]
MEREALARALRRRDQRVYEELMEDYGQLLWTIVSGILSGVGTREDVEEVISDVFWELWRQPEQFDPKRGEIQTLLRVKAQSRAIDRLRKLCRAPTVPLEEAEEASGGDLWECISTRYGSSRLPPVAKYKAAGSGNFDPSDFVRSQAGGYCGQAAFAGAAGV